MSGPGTDARRRRRRLLALLVLLLGLSAGGITLYVATLTHQSDEEGDAQAGARPATEQADADRPGAAGGSVGASSRPAGESLPRKPVVARPRDRSAPEADSTAESAPESAPVTALPSPLPAAASSPYGRFTLVGETDVQPGRGFGESVAVDGDVAVIGAPRFKREVVACGAAWVFERRNGAWVQTQRLDSPRPDRPWFGRRVGVASGRVIVFGGEALGESVHVFRSYSRGPDGLWTATQEVRLPEFQVWDAVAHGDTIAVVVRGAVLVWRFVGEEWTQVQRIEAPGDGRQPVRFGIWLSLSGPALAVHSDGHALVAGSPTVATYVYERLDGAATFQGTPLATLVQAGQNAFGALAHGGTALCWTGEHIRLTIDERAEPTWSRITAPGVKSGSFAPLFGAHGMAADGSLVVAIEVEPAGFAILERRDDGWYRASLPAATVPRGVGEALWHPNVAMGGRTVLAGTGWEPSGSGRAWFFDITDADLAAARRIEPDAK